MQAGKYRASVETVLTVMLTTARLIVSEHYYLDTCSLITAAPIASMDDLLSTGGTP